MTVLLAHISDLHLDGTPETTARATRTMDCLRSLARIPDALVVTGDIADHATPEEYAEAAALLKAPCPVFVCPGNHDDRAALRTGLLGQEGSPAPVNTHHRVGRVSILACDSTIPGEDAGLLAPDTLEWIDRTLSDQPTTPTLLAMHHPPIRVHHPLPDASTLGNPHDLTALLDAHPNVVGILAGHAHTGAAGQIAGRPVVLAPGVTWTLRMPWEGERRVDRGQPPGVAFHVLAEDSGLTTHFRAAA
ncbi:metallophosphoesterase [Nocardiopsis nanhaiensis]